MAIVKLEYDVSYKKAYIEGINYTLFNGQDVTDEKLLKAFSESLFDGATAQSGSSGTGSTDKTDNTDKKEENKDENKTNPEKGENVAPPKVEPKDPVTPPDNGDLTTPPKQNI